MTHSFNAHIAQKYGVNSAILLHCLHMWIEKNRANGRHFYDGHYWAYNSKKAFAELFPYFTARQVDYAIQKLIDEEIIVTGNYNKKPLDRTLWFAITEKGYSILQNCEMHFANLSNARDNDVKCVTNITPLTNSSTYINNTLYTLSLARPRGKHQNVMLTDEHYADIKQKIPDADAYIDSFSVKLHDHGYTYADHYATILAWWKSDKKRRRPHKKAQASSGGSFDANEFFNKAVEHSRRKEGEENGP